MQVVKGYYISATNSLLHQANQIHILAFYSVPSHRVVDTKIIIVTITEER